MDELSQEQVADLNKQATTYGMADGDFVRWGTWARNPPPPPCLRDPPPPAVRSCPTAPWSAFTHLLAQPQSASLWWKPVAFCKVLNSCPRALGCLLSSDRWVGGPGDWGDLLSSNTCVPLGSRMLRKDKEEAEAIKHAKALEEEKAMYSVRGVSIPGSRWVWAEQGSPLTTCHPPGPSLPAPAEGVPREEAAWPQDQPTQVGPHPTLATYWVGALC